MYSFHIKYVDVKAPKNNNGIIHGIDRMTIEESLCKSIKYIECSTRVRGSC